MVFKSGIPLPGDNLANVSQSDLLNNMQSLDSVYGTDHYAFSNLSANAGYHNTVTTPLIVGGVHPTTTTNPVFYGMQDSTNLGVLQYSKMPTVNTLQPPAASPVTYFQSSINPISLAAGATLNVFDFTGIARAMGLLYSMDTTVATNKVITFFVWNGTNISTFVLGNTGLLTQVSGSIIQIKNVGVSTDNIIWTLDFKRLQ